MLDSRHLLWTLSLLVTGCASTSAPPPTATRASPTVSVAPMSQRSAIVSQADARRDDADWGAFYTYFEGESYGARDALAGVAVIDPGQEIHPPHEHAEEEYLMVLEGTGTWHLNGETRAAEAGDLLYAAPWDVHGITNTGTEPLRFVVWKWGAPGVAAPERPE